MNIITISGSPRINGKTAQALDLLEKELIAQGHNIERISVGDYHITGCKGCFACHTISDAPGCIVKDDASAIIDRLVVADAVIYASPLYAYDIAAQLKALVDRHNSVCKWTQPNPFSLFKGKRVALLITCGGPDGNNTEHVQGIFDLMFGRTLYANVMGKYTIPKSFDPDYTERALLVTQKMAQDLTV